MTRRKPITWIVAVLVVLAATVGVGVAQAASSPTERVAQPASGPLRLFGSGQADRRDPPTARNPGGGGAWVTARLRRRGSG